MTGTHIARQPKVERMFDQATHIDSKCVQAGGACVRCLLQTSVRGAWGQWLTGCRGRGALISASLHLSSMFIGSLGRGGEGK